MPGPSPGPRMTETHEEPNRMSQPVTVHEDHPPPRSVLVQCVHFRGEDPSPTEVALQTGNVLNAMLAGLDRQYGLGLWDLEGHTVTQVFEAGGRLQLLVTVVGRRTSRHSWL